MSAADNAGNAPLLRGVARALQILLESADFDAGIQGSLAALGQAANVDRVYLFQNHKDPKTGELLLSQRFEWVREGVSRQIENSELQNLPWEPEFSRWLPILRGGGHIADQVDEMPACERDHLAAQQIVSIALVPVFCDREFWGLIGFDVCGERRSWTPEFIEALHAAAAGIGAALSRGNFESALTAQTAELKRSRRVALSLMEDARASERAAAAASEAKSSFLAMMSHEIRTPLNSIIGFTDLIVSENPEEPIRGYAENVRSSGRLLLSLVSDVLDFARIEANQITLVPEPGNIRDTIDVVVTSFRRTLQEKSIDVHVRISPQMPQIVTLDHGRLHQILLNIFGNALKFTDAGSIYIRVNQEVVGDGMRRILFEVEDTGAGIEPSALERIFEPFIQADRNIHRRYGGTGLGLSICRSLCRTMGGDISAKSAPGLGSCFRFNVLATDHAPSESLPNDRETAGQTINIASRPLKVLVVDDVAVNRQLVCALLRKMGHECATAENGEDAVALGRTGAFDVILMDVLLPGINGIDATRQILSTTGDSNRPWIIGLSADVMPDNRAAAMNAGMHAFLTKPLRSPELAEELKRAQAAQADTAGN